MNLSAAFSEPPPVSVSERSRSALCFVWRWKRSVPRIRSDFEPCFQAAETVAGRFRLPCTGQTLLKRLYKERIY